MVGASSQVSHGTAVEAARNANELLRVRRGSKLGMGLGQFSGDGHRAAIRKSRKSQINGGLLPEHRRDVEQRSSWLGGLSVSRPRFSLKFDFGFGGAAKSESAVVPE